MASWLPEFLRGASVSAPSLWGKLPSCGDFIRHNVTHAHSEALQAWITDNLQAAQDVLVLPQAPEQSLSSQRQRLQDAKWSHLTPLDLPAPAGSRRAGVQDTATGDGYAGLPWCFVLPPGSFAFAGNDYVLGVWMASSDKFGRIYPLVMTQTASARWIRHYFSAHAGQPCDWLFAAARAVAQAIYAEETALDRPQQARLPAMARDAALVQQLEQLWAIQNPPRGWLQHFAKLPPAPPLQAHIPPPHREDPIQRLHGVRYLPWADWPQRLLGSGVDDNACAAFWQQDVQGRFVAASSSLRQLP